MVPGADVFWNPTSLGSFIQLKMLLFNKRHLHSGCVQRQTYGREGEQLVPSNDLSPATTKALQRRLLLPGAPTGSGVPPCICLGLGPTADLCTRQNL